MPFMEFGNKWKKLKLLAEKVKSFVAWLWNSITVYNIEINPSVDLELEIYSVLMYLL